MILNFGWSLLLVLLLFFRLLLLFLGLFLLLLRLLGDRLWPTRRAIRELDWAGLGLCRAN